MDPVKAKRAPLAQQRRVRLALAACAFVTLAVALPALVGGCGAEDEQRNASDAPPSSSRRVEVPFEMQPGMISGVAASKLRVTVYDGSLVARGPAIPGERTAFERP